MKAKQSMKGVGMVTLALASAGLTVQGQAAEVLLNGQPLATSAAPIVHDGRTLVPMRDIFEALGASVNWNGLTQGISANKGNTNISLQIGNLNAMVNGQRVALDQPAILYNGSTMVPLRFVSEAMGAKVDWNNTTEIASIYMDGHAARHYGGHQVAGAREISVPAGAVVRVKMDTSLSSATARRGDPFTATVVSQNPGDSEFPPDSKLEGVVREAHAKDGDNPGVLDLDFRSVLLPGGAHYPLHGSLISLDSKSVDTSNSGRIMAKSSSSNDSKDKIKIIGIGAGAGYVVGRLLNKNSTFTTILGGAAGYLYDRKKDKVGEAKLAAGTQLGVRLDGPVSYADASNYYDQRSHYVRAQ